MTCHDCGAELASDKATRCRRCAMAYARANRGPVRRRKPDQAAVLLEAIRLPIVLQEFVEDHT